jgi:peroxiredoxin Q/BCP
MKFPDFKLLDMRNKEYSLNDFKTKKVIFFIYPKDDTPGCTTENQDFTSLKKEFDKLNITCIGISPDSVDKHKKFIEKYKLENILLSDPKKELIEKVGAWGEKTNYGKTYIGLIRSTFLVDKESGEIEKEWKNVRAKGHAERILKVLQGVTK